MFTTGIRSQSPWDFDAWRLLDEKKRKREKKRGRETEEAVSVTTAIFALCCVKKNPYIFRDHCEQDRGRLW